MFSSKQQKNILKNQIKKMSQRTLPNKRFKLTASYAIGSLQILEIGAPLKVSCSK